MKNSYWYQVGKRVFQFNSLTPSLAYNHALSTLLLCGKLEVIHDVGLSVLGGLFLGVGSVVMLVETGVG